MIITIFLTKWNYWKQLKNFLKKEWVESNFLKKKEFSKRKFIKDLDLPIIVKINKMKREVFHLDIEEKKKEEEQQWKI